MPAMSRTNLINLGKKACILLIIIGLLVVIKSLISSILSIQDRSNILKNLQKQVQSQKQEQAYLTQKLYIAKSDSFVEEEARKLGLVRDGEQIVVDKKIEPEAPASSPENKPNWQKWLNLFF